MATPHEMKPQQPQDAGDGLLNDHQILLSYKQLYGHPASSDDRVTGIQRMFQRLARHYEREVNPLHMLTYPEGLLDLPDELLPLAFERVIRETKFFPSVQEIRATVALDNARLVEELWQPLWMDLLRWVKRSFYDSSAPPSPIDLPGPLAKALETAGGGEIRSGLKALAQYHPLMFGGDNWPFPESPRLAAERIEKRVRDLWESYR